MATRSGSALAAYRGLGYRQLEMFSKSEVAAELYADDRLDGKEFASYVDTVRSVSALAEAEDPDAHEPE